jgi:hypothetical protein
MKHVPFADKPAKSAYMWRAVKLPAPYPVKQSVVANRVAIVGMCEGWGPDFVRAAYRRWFQLGDAVRDITELPDVRARMSELGMSVDFRAGDQFRDLITRENEKYRMIVRQAGIHSD